MACADDAGGEVALADLGLADFDCSDEGADGTVDSKSYLWRKLIIIAYVFTSDVWLFPLFFC